MKKFLLGFLAGALLFSGVTAIAATSYTAYLASFKVFVNGEEFKGTTGEILVVNDRTYLPLRDMGNALGIPVEWNPELGQVEVGVPPEGSQYPEATFIVDGVRSLYLNPTIEFTVESYDPYEVSYSLSSFDKVYIEAVFTSRHGEFSNLMSTYISIDAICDSYPNSSEELMSKIDAMDIRSYNGRLFVSVTNIIQYFRQKEIYFGQGTNTTGGLREFQYIVNRQYTVINEKAHANPDDGEGASEADEALYQEFKSMWRLDFIRRTPENERLYNAVYSGSINRTEFIKKWMDWLENNHDSMVDWGKRLSRETRLSLGEEDSNRYTVSLDFMYNGTALGYAFAYPRGSEIGYFSPNPFLL